MKISAMALLAAATLAVLLQPAGPLATSSWAQTSTADAENRLQAVEDAITQIQSWLDSSRQQRSAEEASLTRLRQDADRLLRQLASNQQRLGTVQQQLEDLNGRQRELLAETATQREQLAHIVRASYLNGRDSQLKLLLNQQDPGTARRMMVYFNTLNASRLAQIRRWQQTLDQLRANRLALQQAGDDLAEINNDLNVQREALQAAQRQREAIIADLQQQMAERQQELETLQQDRANLQALVNEINRIVTDIPPPEDLMPFADNQGKLSWPASGELLARYGQSYGGGNLQRQGIIIASAPGTAVRAVHPGRVVFSDWLRGSGNLVVIDHGNGYITLYAHNQRLTKKQGDWVNRGEALALSGQDGGTGNPGIYFEIRHNRQPLNPVEWLEELAP